MGPRSERARTQPADGLHASGIINSGGAACGPGVVDRSHGLCQHAVRHHRRRAQSRCRLLRPGRADEPAECDLFHVDASSVDEAVGDCARPLRTGVLAEAPMPPYAQPACNPNAVAITDEYGFRYNCRGDRLR